MRRPDALLALLLAVTLATATLLRLNVGSGELRAAVPVLDWGTAVEGDVRHVTVEILNPGDEPCRILTVVPSCVCTVTEGVPPVVLPHQRASFLVSVDSTAQQGRLETYLAIVHDGRNGPTTRVNLIGHVRSALRVTPETVLLDDAHPEAEIIVANRDWRPGDVLRAIDPVGALDVRVLPPVDAEPGTGRVRISCPDAQLSGTFATEIDVSTGRFARRVRVIGEFSEKLRADPRAVYLGPSGAESVAVTAPSAGLGTLTVRALPASAAPLINVSVDGGTLRVSRSTAPPGPMRGAVLMVDGASDTERASAGGRRRQRLFLPVRWQTTDPYAD